MLATGTVVSAGASVFGPPDSAQVRPAVRLGRAGGERLTADGFLRVAERVITRRQVQLTPERRRSLERTYARGITG